MTGTMTTLANRLRILSMRVPDLDANLLEDAASELEKDLSPVLDGKTRRRTDLLICHPHHAARYSRAGRARGGAMSRSGRSREKGQYLL